MNKEALRKAAEALAFLGIAKIKLDGLIRQGHELSGYLFEKDDSFGTIDQWGRVTWLGKYDPDNGFLGVNADLHTAPQADEAVRLLNAIFDHTPEWWITFSAEWDAAKREARRLAQQKDGK